MKFNKTVNFLPNLGRLLFTNKIQVENLDLWILPRTLHISLLDQSNCVQQLRVKT